MSDEKPVNIFECLSCGELWKISYAPGHECPECETNNVIPFDILGTSEIDVAQDERDQLKQELSLAKQDGASWKMAHECTQRAANDYIPKLEAERDAAVKERDEWRIECRAQNAKRTAIEIERDHALESVKLAQQETEKWKMAYANAQKVIHKLKERHQL